MLIKKLLKILFACWMIAIAPWGHAHELSMVEINMYEFKPGVFQWAWATAAKDKPLGEVLKVQWPPGCLGNDQVVQCSGDKGMMGKLEVEGLGKSYSALLFNIKWKDGGKKVYTLTAAQPSVLLFGGANDERESIEIAKAYMGLGIEHILTGWDHLCFVFSLLLLVSFKKRLISTITFFTLAHSITLALSALDVFTLRSAPVEVTIALSIMLVCYEALKTQSSLTHRWPEVVAFAFGLLHGMGFAGALKEIGLPAENIFVALLTFNVGVEIGQLAVILLSWLLYKVWQRWVDVSYNPRVTFLYAIGGFSMFWTVSRVVDMVV
jgi:hydrogenase/urease accessory protein HupE